MLRFSSLIPPPKLPKPVEYQAQLSPNQQSQNAFQATHMKSQSSGMVENMSYRNNEPSARPLSHVPTRSSPGTGNTLGYQRGSVNYDLRARPPLHPNGPRPPPSKVVSPGGGRYLPPLQTSSGPYKTASTLTSPAENPYISPTMPNLYSKGPTLTVSTEENPYNPTNLTSPTVTSPYTNSLVIPPTASNYLSNGKIASSTVADLYKTASLSNPYQPTTYRNPPINTAPYPVDSNDVFTQQSRQPYSEQSNQSPDNTDLSRASTN